LNLDKKNIINPFIEAIKLALIVYEINWVL